MKADFRVSFFCNMEKKLQSRLISFLAALCLFLAAIENAIPKPLPFLRLGLANLPVILALYLLPRRKILLLVIFKILAQGVISGTIFSYVFIFSACGSFSSAIAMMGTYSLSYKRNFASAVGISLFGSLTSTFFQLVLARFLLFGENIKFIAPILLISGLITGLALGVFAEFFMQKSKWFKEIQSEI